MDDAMTLEVKAVQASTAADFIMHVTRKMDNLTWVKRSRDHQYGPIL